MNWYAYAAGDPISLLDPFGLCAQGTNWGLGSFLFNFFGDSWLAGIETMHDMGGGWSIAASYFEGVVYTTGDTLDGITNPHLILQGINKFIRDPLSPLKAIGNMYSNLWDASMDGDWNAAAQSLGQFTIVTPATATALGKTPLGKANVGTAVFFTYLILPMNLIKQGILIMLNKQLQKTFLAVIVAFVAFVIPQKLYAVEYPTANVTWLCDMSDTDNAEELTYTYSLFTGLFNDITATDSTVIILGGDNEKIQPWSDSITADFGGQANVVRAFHCVTEMFSTTLSGTDERFQLVVFSDMCQTVLANEAREQVGVNDHIDEANVENAQKLLDEDLSVLEEYNINNQLDVHVIRWQCENCTELSYNSLSLPEWISTYEIDLQQSDFENRICEMLGELYARVLVDDTLEWQTWNNNQSDIDNTRQLLVLDGDTSLVFESSRYRDWGKLRVVDLDGSDNLAFENGVRYIAIPSLEWEVEISDYNGNLPVTKNSGLSVSVTPTNEEITVRFNRSFHENETPAALRYWNESEMYTIELNWNGTAFTGRHQTELIEMGDYYCEFHLNDEQSASKTFTVENLAPISTRAEQRTLSEAISQIYASKGSVTVNLGDYHLDPDGDELWYDVNIISDSEYLRYSLNGENLILTGLKPGTAQIEIVARDRGDENESYVQMFSDTYEIEIYGKKVVSIWAYMLMIGLIIVIAIIIALLIKRRKNKIKK